MSRTPFDANGHPEAAMDALGRETRTVFDRRGNLTLHLDAAGNATRIEYGAQGGEQDRPVRVTDALGHVWTHAYDARGNRIRSTDPLGRSTRTDHDSRGLPVAVTDAAGRTRRLHGYNAAGELTHVIEAGGSDAGPGKVTHLERDVLGRLVGKRARGDGFVA